MLADLIALRTDLTVLAIGLALLGGCAALAQPARPNVNSIDCAFVRGLNAIERLYLIKKFALTEAEIRAIKKRCNIS